MYAHIFFNFQLQQKDFSKLSVRKYLKVNGKYKQKIVDLRQRNYINRGVLSTIRVLYRNWSLIEQPFQTDSPDYQKSCEEGANKRIYVQ